MHVNPHGGATDLWNITETSSLVTTLVPMQYDVQCYIYKITDNFICRLHGGCVCVYYTDIVVTSQVSLYFLTGYTPQSA